MDEGITMSKGSNNDRLFNEKGDLTYVKPGGGRRRRITLGWFVAGLLVAGVLGYALRSPAGDRFIDKGWKWLMRSAQAETLS